MAKDRAFYQNLAKRIAAQEFPGDARSQSIYMHQIQQESGFDPNARSGAGARGIAQFMPATAAGYHINPLNPAQALHAAARMDKANLKKYGNWNDTLSLYNSGKGWSQGQRIGETSHYVKAIMGASQAVTRGVPLTGRGVDASAKIARSIPSSPKRQALVASLLAANQKFVETGQAGQVDPAAIQAAMAQVQTIKGAGKATFTTDHTGPISPNAKGIIQLAKQYLGTPYKWGGANPKTGFDCSGFVQWLMARKGVKVGRTTYDQIKQGKPVNRKNLKPGDTVFFSKAGDVHHEGLYIGHGQFIHAPHTGDVIKVSSLNEPYYATQFAGGRRH